MWDRECHLVLRHQPCHPSSLEGCSHCSPGCLSLRPILCPLGSKKFFKKPIRSCCSPHQHPQQASPQVSPRACAVRPQACALLPETWCPRSLHQCRKVLVPARSSKRQCHCLQDIPDSAGIHRKAGHVWAWTSLQCQESSALISSSPELCYPESCPAAAAVEVTRRNEACRCPWVARGLIQGSIK